jgi:hypothetical protein
MKNALDPERDAWFLPGESFSRDTPPEARPGKSHAMSSGVMRDILLVGAVITILGWFLFATISQNLTYRRASGLIREISESRTGRVDEAVKALQKMGMRAAPAVADAVKDPDVRLRRAGLIACEQVVLDCRYRCSLMNCAFGIVPERWGVDEALDVMGNALGRLFSDADPEVRIKAASLFLMIPEKTLTQSVDATRQAMAVLKGAFDEDHDPKNRLALIKILGENRPGAYAESVSILVAAMKGDDEQVRLAAVDALQSSLANRYGSTDAVEALREALPYLNRYAETGRGIGYRALAEVGVLGVAEVIPRLVEGLRSPDTTQRNEAAAGLRRIAWNDRMIDQLIRLLDDPDANVRRHVVGAIAQRGPAALHAEAVLAKIAAEDTDESVRREAKETLAYIRKYR